MIRRSTWVVLVILALLVGFTFLFQRYQNKETDIITTATPTAPRKLLLDMESSQITGIQISNSSGGLLEIHKDALTGNWAIQDVPIEQTDTNQIGAAIERLLSSQIIETLTQPPPLDSMGLAVPLYTVILTTSDGSELIANVGILTPVGSGYYVRVASGPVVITEKTGMDGAIEWLSNPPILPTPTQAAPTQAAASNRTPLPGENTETATPAP